MANLLTLGRVLCSISLLFCRAFSPAFYALYLAAGLSDMIDGAAARRTNTASAFGARFDTAADLVFVTVCLIKLMPILEIPKWLLIWIVVIALIKVLNVVSGFVVRRKLVVPHTLMNKVTGILLFILPLTRSFLDLKYSAALVCAVACFSAIQEGHFIRTEREDFI